MRLVMTAALGFLVAAAVAAEGAGTALVFPAIARFGGIAPTPGAAEPPQAGAKIVFDIVADSKPDEVNKGLESVARYLNLHAQAGHAAGDVKLALVLHGGATKVALQHAAYAQQTGGAKNPNLELIRELRAQGVEVFVCGQSLARNRFAAADVAGDVTVAVSAMTVNVNKQRAGYAYLAIH